METAHKELRTLKMSHGIHKSRNSSNDNDSVPRNAAFQACQACYARKKRCVTSPSHHQCTYCFREGQRCVPRERPTRPLRKYIPETPSELSRPIYNLPLPQGIDHEVPRWSAMYSMFSEMLRLIPPEEYPMRDKRKRAVSTEREQSPDRKKSCSAAHDQSVSDTRAGDTQCESQESSVTAKKTDPTMSALDASSYGTSTIIPTPTPTPTPRDELMTIARNTGAGMFWELDALLRF